MVTIREDNEKQFFLPFINVIHVIFRADNSVSPRGLAKSKAEDTSPKEISPSREANKTNKNSTAESELADQTVTRSVTKDLKTSNL